MQLIVQYRLPFTYPALRPGVYLMEPTSTDDSRQDAADAFEGRDDNMTARAC